MKKNIFFPLILLLSLSACKEDDGEVQGISVLAPQTLQMTVTGTNSWPGLCHKIQYSMQNINGTATSSGQARTLQVSADVGAIYSNAACTNVISTITLSTTDYGTQFYYKSTSAATPTIHLTGSGLTSASLSLTVVEPAGELVLGQADFTTNASGTTSQSFDYPVNSVVAGGKLFVADYNNSRILIWNTIPTSDQQAADIVLGQPNMTSSTCNTGGSVTAQTLCNPSSVHSDGTRLVVSDEGNHRVLIWTTLPTTDGEAADIVLGQPNMTSNDDNLGAGPTAGSLSYPACVWISGTRLYVADGANNRILIWTTLPSADGTVANVVMGQPNMTSNTNGTSATTLDYPYMVSVHSNKVFVSDFVNNRVLVWNTPPATNGVAANVVMGQPNMTSNTANNGGISASTLYEPGGVAVDTQGRTYVFDYSNNRILVWNQIPTTNGAAASAVFGQPDFNSNLDNQGGAPSASTLFSPWGASITSDGKLWIADYENHRIIYYTIPY